MTDDVDDRAPSPIETIARTINGAITGTGETAAVLAKISATLEGHDAFAAAAESIRETFGGTVARAGGDFRDWLPPGSPEPNLDELMTREEVLEEARSVPMRISESTLRLRESQGILPRPWRRWRDGATRALYPRWMPELVLFTDIVLDSRSGRATVEDPADVAARARRYVFGILERDARWRSKAMTEDIPAALAHVADLFEDAERRPTRATITLKSATGELVATFDGIQIPGGHETS